MTDNYRKLRTFAAVMSIVEIFLLAVALAMDCFTVSIVSGVIMRRFVARVAWRMACLFGFFQGLMPLLGWLGISYFSRYMIDYDHWIAFSLLLYVGGRMVYESFGEGEEQHFHPERLRTQLLLSVSTSIDALAVGVSMVCVGYDEVSSLPLPLSIIACVSLLFSLAGTWLGVRFGTAIACRIKPERIGGIILILIGVKVLLEHLEVI